MTVIMEQLIHMETDVGGMILTQHIVDTLMITTSKPAECAVLAKKVSRGHTKLRIQT